MMIGLRSKEGVPVTSNSSSYQAVHIMWWLHTAVSWKKMIAHSSRSCCSDTGQVAPYHVVTPCHWHWCKVKQSSLWHGKNMTFITWRMLWLYCSIFLVFKMGEYHQALCCFSSGWNEYIHDLSIIKMWWRNMSLSIC